MVPALQLVVPIGISLAALVVSFFTFRMQRADTSYSDIDETYFNLLKIALTNPDLRNYEKTSTFYKQPYDSPFRMQYEIYAYMCWNLAETIFDREKDGRGRFHLSSTWFPVIVEENRLHYSWFKHNLRLFKAEFQRFVTHDLNDIELINGAAADLDEVYERLIHDFPASELKEKSHFEHLMSRRKYKLLLARHRIFNMIIGYAFIFEPDSPKITWLDYLAIDGRFRNAGYGTLLFNKVAQLRKGDNLGVMLEIEPADSDEPDIHESQERRIAFYKALGAVELKIPYRFPTSGGSEPLRLYFRPSPGIHLLPKGQLEAVIGAAYEYIHADVPHRQAVFAQFSGAIDDQQF